MSGKYYEDNIVKLEEEIERRQSRSIEIREAIDAWAEEKYTIPAVNLPEDSELDSELDSKNIFVIMQ